MIQEAWEGGSSKVIIRREGVGLGIGDGDWDWDWVFVRLASFLSSSSGELLMSRDRRHQLRWRSCLAVWGLVAAGQTL